MYDSRSRFDVFSRVDVSLYSMRIGFFTNRTLCEPNQKFDTISISRVRPEQLDSMGVVLSSHTCLHCQRRFFTTYKPGWLAAKSLIRDRKEFDSWKSRTHTALKLSIVSQLILLKTRYCLLWASIVFCQILLKQMWFKSVFWWLWAYPWLF
jgi:hypothetical protein